jgi:hypothetical protein
MTVKKKVTVQRGRGSTKERAESKHLTGNRPKKRVPLDGRRARMLLDEASLDPAYRYKWVNDEKGRIHSYTEAGYEHVRNEEGVAVGHANIDSGVNPESVVSIDGGRGVTVYLMKQPMEYFLEDKQLRQDNSEDGASQLRRSLNSNVEGEYGGVKFD